MPKDVYDWLVGDVILDRYEVRSILGEGGMGRVYKIYDRQRNTYEAVKSPKPEIFTTANGKERFIQEAETWVKLKMHSNVVYCSAVEILGDIPRIFIDYVDGGSLSDWIRDQRLYEGRKGMAMFRMLRIAIQFAWGLHAAHEQGVVHQDVKPANVMMSSEGLARITDFGLARARIVAGEPEHLGGTARSDRQSILVSSRGMTPAYCSPEQAAGRPLSRKTDIWSWGVSVLEMFVGGVTWMSGIMAREVLTSYQRQHQAIPPMPPEIMQLLDRCFQYQPEARPATMEEVATELEACFVRLIGLPYSRESSKFIELSTSTFFVQAVSLNRLERHEEALVLCERAIQDEPVEAVSYSLKGIILGKLRRQEEALQAYEQAIRLDPTSAEVYGNKGLLLRRLNRMEEALAAYEQAIHIDPTHVSAYFGKGMALQKLKRDEEALPVFEQAIQLNPTDANIHFLKGCSLEMLGRAEEALTAFEQVIHLEPTRISAYSHKGILLRTLGRHEEALEAFEQSIRLDPTNADAYQAKGEVLDTLGRLEEALEAFEQSIRLNPKDASVYFSKGLTLWGLKHMEEALANFEYAIQLDPKNATFYRTKGILLRIIGHNEEALTALEYAVQLRPNDAEAYQNKGYALEKLGRMSEAHQAYQKAHELRE
ncbi:serine/threonine-protein kinase [Ktedonobacter racemifer]|uniref:Serine/threonine protein kinase with TPR repeats n=1 Tax=Ktedonobacter racemifer DSM 44963 TaxID=485913 RepID=D6TWQ7_KTERA|nr:serine/threonine-protein kinase [Ktedonobacter racemifer]EFH84640.1 serine/threonine protein kinase with TPR repeats [Ktedonobacter racemifer DSM 44963]